MALHCHNISRVSEKSQMRNAGIRTAYDRSELPTVQLDRVFLRGRKRHQTRQAIDRRLNEWRLGLVGGSITLFYYT